MTVEPGIYFIPALLQDQTTRAEHRDAVDWDRVDALLDFGGIRLEDNVLITDSGCEVLTSRVPLRDQPGDSPSVTASDRTAANSE